MKPPPMSLEKDGESIGIAGMAEVAERALEILDATEEEIDATLVNELKESLATLKAKHDSKR
jgi:hypothetical protein